MFPFLSRSTARLIAVFALIPLLYGCTAAYIVMTPGHGGALETRTLNEPFSAGDIYHGQEVYRYDVDPVVSNESGRIRIKPRFTVACREVELQPRSTRVGSDVSLTWVGYLAVGFDVVAAGILGVLGTSSLLKEGTSDLVLVDYSLAGAAVVSAGVGALYALAFDDVKIKEVEPSVVSRGSQDVVCRDRLALNEVVPFKVAFFSERGREVKAIERNGSSSYAEIDVQQLAAFPDVVSKYSIKADVDGFNVAEFSFPLDIASAISRARAEIEERKIQEALAQKRREDDRRKVDEERRRKFEDQRYVGLIASCLNDGFDSFMAVLCGEGGGRLSSRQCVASRQIIIERMTPLSEQQKAAIKEHEMLGPKSTKDALNHLHQLDGSQKCMLRMAEMSREQEVYFQSLAESEKRAFMSATRNLGGSGGSSGSSGTQCSYTDPDHAYEVGAQEFIGCLQQYSTDAIDWANEAGTCVQDAQSVDEKYRCKDELERKTGQAEGACRGQCRSMMQSCGVAQSRIREICDRRIR